MTDEFKTRWVIVGFCWMAVVLLSAWNLAKIDSIDKAREKKEIYLMDEQFWKYNAANIKQILKKSGSLIQVVESSKLGLFEFERNIRNLASNFGLHAVTLASESNSNQDGNIPIKISFRSTLEQAARWFDHLESEVPYGQIIAVNIDLDEVTKQNKFTVSVNYRYNQSSKEGPI